ncbi:MAG TPA: ATP-binding cassette domain-containing protein [Flavisolibacter sp.]|nr:ATP-binding cassette domain-containing protein [Flavisolibacter sp.]
MPEQIRPAARLWNLVQEERSDITAIYFFAILGGLIQLSLPVGIQAIIGFVLGGTLSASLVVLISILVFAVLFTGMMQMGQMRVIERIQQRIFARYAFAFADRIPKLDLKKIEAFYLPELVNRFFDTTSLQKSLSKILLEIPAAMIQILFGLLLLSFYHPFFILFGLLLLLLLWLILYFTGSKGLQSSLAESSHKYAVVGWLEEMARMSKSFKLATDSGLHLKKTDERTIRYLHARTRHFGVLLFQYKTLIFFKVAVTAAMLTVGVTLLLDQQINIGQFVAAEIIIITVINAVEKTIINLDSVYDVLTAIEKVSKLTDKPVEASGSYALEDRQSGIMVEARTLSFEHEEGRPVVRNLSCVINRGEKVAITGNDGSGKSTLLRLLLGVYKNFTGALLINGTPIGNYDMESLRRRTGMLFPQENIFNGSLLENISMGRENIDTDYVAKLSEVIGLKPFIASLPFGYDTDLDPTGKRLPRNVIQKILLLRALAHRPRLLLMEEPWQGIEEVFKSSIQNLLLTLENTTVIIATNDPSFNGRCHQVIQLQS